jgi:hypothetical protein
VTNVAIADDIRVITDDALRNLDALHDYFEHSKLVWDSFRTGVSAGLVLTHTNAVTGTTLDHTGLVAVSPRYQRDYLIPFTFRQFVSEFESFFFAFLARLMRHNPWPFKNSQVPFETVLRAKDRDEVIDGVIAKQLNDVKYENVREWFKFLEGTMALGCPTADEIDAVAELKATRDILEHNDGVVNETYARKTGKLARYPVGEVVELDDDYHLAGWRLVRKIAVEMGAAALVRLAKA